MLKRCNHARLQLTHSLSLSWGTVESQFPRVSSTASQAGETDQTTHINSTAHLESCEIASPATPLRRRKAYLYSALKQFISSAQAKSPERPNQHRTIFQNIINRSSPSPNGKSNYNRIVIYHFRSIEIEKQSHWPEKILTLYQFPAVQ